MMAGHLSGGHSAKEVRMEGHAQLHVGDRYYYTTDDSPIPSKYIPMKRDLYSTNPPDDLAALRRRLGNRAEGTCAWILDRPDFQNWLQSPETQLLRLVGEPGIGKSMMSTFLIEELEKKCKETQNVIFAYFLFDNKDEDRRKAVALLRTLLLQLLRQNPDLFQVMEPDYEQMGQKLMGNFDALWRIWNSMLEHLQTGYIWVLVDAVDECDQPDRKQFLQSLGSLITKSSPHKGAKVKFVLTCRPEEDIQDLLNGVGQSLQLDKGTINKDLKQFIEIRINEISRLRPQWNAQQIKDTLNQKVGGTFLWVALILKEIMEPGKIKTMQQVRRKLEAIPTDLHKTYDRILGGIDEEDLDDAKILLQCVVAARRPLRVAELTEAHAFLLPDWPKNMGELGDAASSLTDSHKLCGSLLFVDTQDNTVNLIHQSAKDYLLSSYLQQHPQLAFCHVVLDSADLRMFESCWRCLNLTDLDDFSAKLHPAWELQRFPDSNWIVHFKSIEFLRYALAEWDNHVIAADRAIGKSCIWEGSYLRKRSRLCDIWLRRVITRGHEATVQILLEKGAEVNARDNYGITALMWATLCKQEAIVRLLLGKKADNNAQDKHGYTALILAAQSGQEAIARLLLGKGPEVNAQTKHGFTALMAAVQNRSEAMVHLLLEKGADVNARDNYGHTALIRAAQYEEEVIERLLLEKGADVNAQNEDGSTALIWAVENGQEAIARLLLEKGADTNARDKDGATALILAAENGQEVIARLLLEKGPEVNAQTKDGYTALMAAVQNRSEAIVYLLLEKGADVNARYRDEFTALKLAENNRHEATTRLLLQALDR